MFRVLFRFWRRLNPEISLGFLIATLFWIGILGWQAAYAPTEMEKQKCYDAAQKSGHKSEECKTIWERTSSDPVAFFTLWLVIFTAGLTVSTVMLWRAGEKQFRHARIASMRQSRNMQASIAISRESADAAQRSAVVSEQALIVSQRAYVSLKRPTNAPVLDNAKRFRGHNFWVIWENSGNTEAHEFTTAMNGLWFAPDIPDDFDFHDLGDGTFGSTLGARSEIEGGKSFLNPETLKMIAERRCRYYFWGWGEYKDGFAGTPVHRIEFCFELQIDGDVDNANFTVYFRVHKKHNRHFDKERTT